MKRQKEIKLNDFQLNVLLSDEEKNGYRYLLDNGVYCNGCQGVCKMGVEIKSVKLDGLNDIVMEGTCNASGHRVARVMEFGEGPEFFETGKKSRLRIFSPPFCQAPKEFPRKRGKTALVGKGGLIIKLHITL